MLTALDPDLYPVVAGEEWVFVTNNEKVFRGLAVGAQLHPGLIILPQSTVNNQQRWLDQVITYIEQHASDDGESAADWMVCRIVTYDERSTAITHDWLPEP